MKNDRKKNIFDIVKTDEFAESLTEILSNNKEVGIKLKKTDDGERIVVFELENKLRYKTVIA